MGVVGEFFGDGAEGVGGALGSFLDVFDEAVGEAAFEFGALSVVDEDEHTFAGGDACGVGFGGWGEHAHDEAPVCHEAVGVLADGGGEVACGLEFPAAMEVVDALVGVVLSAWGGGGDSALEAVGEGEDGWFGKVFDAVRDGGFDGGNFVVGGVEGHATKGEEKDDEQLVHGWRVDEGWAFQKKNDAG